MSTYASLNASIENANKTFPPPARETVDARQKIVRAKIERLDALSVAVGIPLVKRGDVSMVIPTAVRVRQSRSGRFGDSGAPEAYRSWNTPT